MPRDQISYDDITYRVGNGGDKSGSLSPFTFLCFVLVLVLFGLVVLYSISFPIAVREGLPHYHYFAMQCIAAGGGFLAGIGLYFPPLSLGPMAFAFLCGISAKYLRKYRGVWEYALMPVTVTLAGIINSFVVGVLTFTWYQIAVMGTEGAFWDLAAINFVGRLSTKPLTIIASTLLVFLIDRAAYRPVISRIVSRRHA